jgi:hypothetical protein
MGEGDNWPSNIFIDRTEIKQKFKLYISSNFNNRMYVAMVEQGHRKVKQQEHFRKFENLCDILLNWRLLWKYVLNIKLLKIRNLFYFGNETCHNEYGTRIIEYVKSATKNLFQRNKFWFNLAFNYHCESQNLRLKAAVV